jgi:hypothetical protein
MRSDLYQLSSRYYELIPKLEFKSSPVQPIATQDLLNREITLLENLTYVEKAVKILLGAQYRLKELNPVDYVLQSMNIQIENLNHYSNEFNLLLKYIHNSKHGYKIANIFKIQRKGEGDNMMQWKTSPNHMLLFHGSKVFNFIGILCSGLRVAPPEAPTTGYLFGKGVYFADMFDKSVAYCDYYEIDEPSGKKKKFRYMLMCEVALGNIFEVAHEMTFDSELGFLKSNI